MGFLFIQLPPALYRNGLRSNGRRPKVTYPLAGPRSGLYLLDLLSYPKCIKSSHSLIYTIYLLGKGVFIILFLTGTKQNHAFVGIACTARLQKYLFSYFISLVRIGLPLVNLHI